MERLFLCGPMGLLLKSTFMDQLSYFCQALPPPGELLHSGEVTGIYFVDNNSFFRHGFISKVNRRIDEILNDYTTTVNKKRKNPGSVHIRRGDHLEYEKLNGVTHLKTSYFFQAMDIYRDKLKHPVFIIVTDDPQWAYQHLHKSFKPYFTGKINGQFQC